MASGRCTSMRGGSKPAAAAWAATSVIDTSFSITLYSRISDCGWGDVHANGVTAHLRQPEREPARRAAELEHACAAEQVSRLEQQGEMPRMVNHVLRVGERLLALRAVERQARKIPVGPGQQF